MKAIPIITALLICQTMFMEHALSPLGWWHARLFRTAGIDQQFIDRHAHWLVFFFFFYIVRFPPPFGGGGFFFFFYFFFFFSY